MKETNKAEIKSLFNSLDRNEIARCLGVSLKAVAVCIERSSIPAMWFEGLNALAESKGIEIDESLFSFKNYELPSEASNELPQ